MKLRKHDFKLQGERVFLRPMTEHDWVNVTKWETDPEIIYWAESSLKTRKEKEVKDIVRKVSQHAYCFIIELDGKPIGNCWLQELNVESILKEYPQLDCRRVNLIIGEKEFWGRGLGIDVIRVLTRFAFELQKADMVFAIFGDYNERSQWAFMKAGYSMVMKLEEPAPSKAKMTYVFGIKKAAFENN